MKILFLNYMRSSLPTLIRTLELALATSREGHEVTLVYMHKNFTPSSFFFDLVKSYEWKNLKIKYSKTEPAVISETEPQIPIVSKIRISKPSLAGILKQMLFSLRYIKSEWKLIKELKPDVIVARPDHVISFIITKFFLKKPLVLETDGPIEELDYYWGISSKYVRHLDLFRAKCAEAILYISDTCGKLWKDKNIPEESLFYCPNGADPDVFKSLPSDEREKRKKKLELDGCIVFGFSGNQRSWHGVNSLLQTASSILNKEKRVKFIIIGTLEEKGALGLDSLPEELIKNQVIFTGPIEYSKMPEYIDLADIMVMPYPHLDMFHFSPMKMFEALCMGKIIIASAQGQITDICSSLPTAILYDPRNKDGLFLAIEKGVDMVLAGKNGSAGREFIIKEHTWHQRGEVVSKACHYALSRQQVK